MTDGAVQQAEMNASTGLQPTGGWGAPIAAYNIPGEGLGYDNQRFESQRTQCTSPQQCAVGYACAGGICVRAFEGNPGSINGGNGGGCDNGGSTSGCNSGGPGSCTSGPTCGGSSPDSSGLPGCCGNPIAFVYSPDGVRPICEVRDRSKDECSHWCDGVFKQFGHVGIGCGDEAPICPPCEECDWFTKKCVPLRTFGDLPCYCAGGCLPCQSCVTEGAFAGECARSSSNECDVCVDISCKCGCEDGTASGCGKTEFAARQKAKDACTQKCPPGADRDADCDNSPCGQAGLEKKLISRWNYYLTFEETNRHTACTDGNMPTPDPANGVPFFVWTDPCGKTRGAVFSPPPEGEGYYFLHQGSQSVCLNCDSLRSDGCIV